MKFDELSKEIAETKRVLRCSCHSHNGLVLGGLTKNEESVRLDKVGSVSALELSLLGFELSDEEIDNQYRRFLSAV